MPTDDNSVERRVDEPADGSPAASRDASSRPAGRKRRSADPDGRAGQPPVDDTSIPVFCYHGALPEELGRDLRFLADNRYTTLTASRLVDVLRGDRPAPERPVALTFDDALTSVLDVGLPLLRRFDMRATVFAITGLTPERRASPERPEGGILGWSELAELLASGHFEVGSHGHRHNPVHVAPGQGPPLALGDYPRRYDAPVPYREDAGAATIAAAAGAPTRPSAPLLAAEQVLLDGEPVAAGPLIRADLAAARRLLLERLGVERAHLALPYGAGREDLPAMAAAAGFESTFWSDRPERTDNRPGDDPYRIVRRKHDYLRRLPGRGRRSWLGLQVFKIARRLRGDPWE